MSIEAQVFIGSWIAVAVIVFLCASLALDDERLPERDRIWIGRIGLAAPLWPLVLVIVVALMFVLMARDLRRAARGRQ